MKKTFADKIEKIIDGIKDTKTLNREIKRFIDSLETKVSFTHRHYIKDDEYIPLGEDIPTFLKREIEKPIIRWQDRPQLGYEILPNKYFYKYTPPPKTDDLLKEFWELENHTERLLKTLLKAQNERH